MNIIVNGLSVSYTKEGRGPAVLFVHGWGDTKETFNTLIKKFAERHTIIALDLPGFGASEPPDSAWSLENYAVFLLDFLKKIGKTEIYAAVGHSNGGAIALKALSMNILSTDRLVLLASSGVRSSGGVRKKILNISAKIAKIPLFALPNSSRQKIKKNAYKMIGSDLLVVEHMQETFKLVVSEDISEQIVGVNTKALLIYGSKDKETPVTYGEILNKALPNSELIIINGASHFLHQANTDEVVVYVENFLK